MAVISDYQNAFHPSVYLKLYDSDSDAIPRVQHALRCYHDVFQSLPCHLKVLCYSCGPVLVDTISAATKASEIVLSDFVDKNCKALHQWLNRDPAAYDWWNYFSFVVQELEGKEEEEVKERQEQVRQLVKAVVHCDITKDPPIQRGFDQLYDVVISSLVMEASAHNHEEYVSNTHRLSKLVKPGGLILG